MRKLIVVLMTLMLTQSGCSVLGGYTDEVFQPYPSLEQERQDLERLKREFLQIEDLKIGRGPIAAFGRKITADVVIRYASDGTLAYEGPVLAYWGIDGAPFIHNSLRKTGLLSLEHTGILLGLNGMAVGGKRRFTIAPKLVCDRGIFNVADRHGSCLLVKGSNANTHIHIKSLTVEATLTGACAPLSLVGRRSEDICWDMDEPQREAGDPIWRMYYAEPLAPRGSQ